MLSVSTWGRGGRQGPKLSEMYGAFLLDFQACGGPDETMALKRMLDMWK